MFYIYLYIVRTKNVFFKKLIFLVHIMRKFLCARGRLFPNFSHVSAPFENSYRFSVLSVKRSLVEAEVAVADRNIDFVYRRFDTKTVLVVSKLYSVVVFYVQFLIRFVENRFYFKTVSLSNAPTDDGRYRSLFSLGHCKRILDGRNERRVVWNSVSQNGDRDSSEESHTPR